LFSGVFIGAAQQMRRIIFQFIFFRKFRKNFQKNLSHHSGEAYLPYLSLSAYVLLVF